MLSLERRLEMKEVQHGHQLHLPQQQQVQETATTQPQDQVRPQCQRRLLHLVHQGMYTYLQEHIQPPQYQQMRLHRPQLHNQAPALRPLHHHYHHHRHHRHLHPRTERQEKGRYHHRPKSANQFNQPHTTLHPFDNNNNSSRRYPTRPRPPIYLRISLRLRMVLRT